ncbi:MAG: adenosylcobalamin-dependent ribonucleoside-diphosphate reductase [Proteobacteria bacterium]|nr:adenosylcobalamin-dependent ribonucleoside-diphosphate reductase [Pseudomonadota bacterium]
MTKPAHISQQIWEMKYRLKGADGRPVDKTMADTWRRVARALAAPEQDSGAVEKSFFEAMEDFRFLPAGRILAGAGAGRRVTLFNCFVMGDIPDDMTGIFEHLKEAALTMQQGGGIGYDFSSLRPKGAPVNRVGADASGPLSFMDVWDSMCRTIMSAGSRRGAMMGVLACDHPDIEAFIEAKREPGRLRMFNLSVLITDAFMQAIREDAAWELKFDGVTDRSLPARELWETIMRSTYAYAEPGVVFIDRINALNNLHYCETIHATNPCGEQPLPPYGACLLGSVNLARLVADPFTDNARLDIGALEDLVTMAVRMLDNAIDVSNFPLPAQQHEAKAKRRLGLGVTGLADALIMCGARYGGGKAVKLIENWMRVHQRAAYLASVELAREKGPFPLYDKEKYLNGETVAKLDQDVRDAITRHGIRNALLTSIAPTGTISLLADNVSSGLEPVFSFKYTRRVMMPDGARREESVTDYAYREFRRQFGDDAPLTGAFVDAQGLSPNDHLVMQAAVQKYVDSSISKTINCPEGITFAAFKDIYAQAFDLGCKGCTTYRPNEITGAVLEVKDSDKANGGPAEPELPLQSPVITETPKDLGDAGPVTHLFEPLDRPGGLEGKTYKLRWPDSDHAIYITLNDILDDQGRTRPFEIFINSKNTEHYAWTVALTRMISAVFRRGGDVSFVVEELKAVFDPRGGQWMGGRYVPSLLAAIGGVIEEHMISTGFLKGAGEIAAVDEAKALNIAALGGGSGGGSGSSSVGAGNDTGQSAMPFRQCPKCGQASLVHEEGCDNCRSCGYSKCA